jgi:DICT domain-containing protein
MEDEALARACRPVVFAAFQREAFYRHVEHRYKRLARGADTTVVLADFDRLRERRDRLVEVPIGDGDAMADEWAVVIDAPGYSACLVAWEQPTRLAPAGPRDRERRFESAWTTDPRVTRRAAVLGARLVGRRDAELGRRLEAQLTDRALALEEPAPALTALTNRIVEYVAG